jgi:hypothetical protein
MGWPGQKIRAYLQNNQIKKGWRHGTSGGVPTSQAQSSEFKPCYPSPNSQSSSSANVLQLF